MKEWIDGVPVEYGAGAWSSADETRPHIKRMIAGMDVRSVTVCGTVTFRMERDVEVVFMGFNGGPTLREALAEHDKAIDAHTARGNRPHVVDANDAHVALAHGGRDMMRQLARTADKPLRICAWNTGDPSITPVATELQQVEGVRVMLRNGRISSYVHRGEQTWSHGSLLVGRDVQMPASLVAALPGRLLDDVAEGTMLAGLGLTIAKAWNVSGSLGMSFKPRIISIHEALQDHGERRIAA